MSLRVAVRSALLLCLLGGTPACGDAPASAPDAAAPDAALPDAAPPDATPGPYPLDEVEVTWTPCSLVEGADDGLGECADAAMPLFWSAHDGRFFVTRAKRLLASGARDGQLWLLHGGPGGAGTVDFPGWMLELQDRHPTLDVYTLDPRGSGLSGYAGCPTQEAPGSDGGEQLTPAEAAACVAHLEADQGDRLATLGTTSAAMDLAAFIHHTRQDDVRLLIWGGSGGTFWAHRYLQLFPDGADGVVLEGIAPADFSMAFQDEYADVVVREIFARCTADATCAEKLPDPVAALETLYEDLDAGHCPIGIDRSMLAELVDYFQYYHPLSTLIPPLVYRLTRCDAADVDALVHLFGVLFPQTPAASPTPSFSMVLFFNETCSELWAHPAFPTSADRVTYLDGVYVDNLLPTGKGYDRNAICDAWPGYADALDDQFGDVGIPLLMLQGVLDPATPHGLAVALADRYAGPHQTFVAVPNAAHNVVGGSPTPDGDCGMRLFDAFLADPTATLDASCALASRPLDFAGNAGLAAYLWGTADAFENVPAPAQKSLRAYRPLRPHRPGPALRAAVEAWRAGGASGGSARR